MADAASRAAALHAATERMNAQIEQLQDLLRELGCVSEIVFDVPVVGGKLRWQKHGNGHRQDWCLTYEYPSKSDVRNLPVPLSSASRLVRAMVATTGVMQRLVLDAEEHVMDLTAAVDAATERYAANVVYLRRGAS